MHFGSEFFATCARQLEPLLVQELIELGASAVKETRAGVTFTGDLGTAYRAMLWSRLASRILVPIARFEAASFDALYELCHGLPWEEHLGVAQTFAIDVSLTRSPLTNSQFAAQRVKDALVDRLRERLGDRPNVDTERPDVRFNVHHHESVATVAVDLAGVSLHRRGYREEAGEAPLRETLAAAMLMRAEWPRIMVERGALVDPMCGSGTIVIEAALMALDIAPGLLRGDAKLGGWLGHQSAVWLGLLEEARARKRDVADVVLLGSDIDAGLLRRAGRNASRAGVDKVVRFAPTDLRKLQRPEELEGRPALVITNPPYGERIGDPALLKALHTELGLMMRRVAPGAQAAVLVEHEDLGMALGLRAHRRWRMRNGDLDCWLLKLEVPATDSAAASKASAGREMLSNRLTKNLKHLSKWAKRIDVDCFRVYDADLPEYAMAIDLYGQHAVLQEYEAPAEIDPVKVAARLADAVAVLPDVLHIPRENVVVKTRRRQRRGQQYEALSTSGRRLVAREGDCHYLVNLTDYLDTGLFLDHRPVRALIRRLASGKRFLNLFAYTGTATVAAAKGGAEQSLTIDMSGPYLDWARDNFLKNGLDLRRHRLLQADCLAWLMEPEGEFDFIFLDPPTFSTSKRMAGTLDVQRDHVELIERTSALLAPGGTLLFSCNFQRFKLNHEALARYAIEEISAKTVDPDFARHPRIHKAFFIRRTI